MNVALITPLFNSDAAQPLSVETLKSYTGQTVSHDALHGLGLKLSQLCPALQSRLACVSQYQAWPLFESRRLVAPHDYYVPSSGVQTVYLGDAAHPMRPHLGQGAAMALEDAWQLALEVKRSRSPDTDLPDGLSEFALSRWPRVARVQAAARRNGTIFHASGPLRWARNVALLNLGGRLLDTPWLHAAPTR